MAGVLLRRVFSRSAARIAPPLRQALGAIESSPRWRRGQFEPWKWLNRLAMKC